ncbi:uncharacterized protein LOC100368280 [Saccoglossus kowalevskii]|uniref:Glutathione S-transferase DHAR3, chloroplastic-like n=1 Tax=Saccoglossus kowalevskii TaxID=10224 RepID=A0ABM0GR55_SACKO|nr:PREDICTED: glutathione S-transferase DHAR3, chloroplastic-like [Saccoglossus kowalevskii]
MELYVKAGRDGNTLGDCPFCHRIQMVLQLKGLDYQLVPINMQIKPREFLDMNPSGKVPVLYHNGVLMDDSAVIADYLERTFPEPSLAASTKVAENAGSNIFQRFTAYLKNKDPKKQDQMRDLLRDELQKLNSVLANSSGDYLDGDILKLPDCNILPKLYHVKIAARHYKKFEMPDEFPSLKKYFDLGFENEAFLKTKCEDEEIIFGWSKHIR